MDVWLASQFLVSRDSDNKDSILPTSKRSRPMEFIIFEAFKTETK